MRYCTYDQWKTRAHSETLPKEAEGDVDQDRVQALLDDAAGWFMGFIPGALIDDEGAQIATADLPEALQIALIEQSVTYAENMLLSEGERMSKKDARLCARALIDLVRLLAYCPGDAAAEPATTPDTPVTPSGTGISYAEIASYTFPFAFQSGNGLYATTIRVALLESGTLYTMRINDTENQGTRTDELSLMTRAMFDAIPASQMAVIQIAADTTGAGVSSESATANYFRVDAGLFGRSDDADPVVLFAPPRANTGPFVLTLARVIA